MVVVALSEITITPLTCDDEATGLSVVTSSVGDMTSSAPPRWALGDPAEEPAREPAAEVGRFSESWWTRALRADPLTGSIAERRRIRPAVAAALEEPAGPQLVAAVDALHAAVGASSGELDLTSREWTEVTAAVERATSYLFSLKLESVARLDAAKLAEQPSRAYAKDSRRPASDELAPVLRVAGRTASHLVGLARQLAGLPAAEEALTRGLMTPAQLEALADVCRRLPEGPAGDQARRTVEAKAVEAAETLSRARLTDALEEAALAADPGFAARSMAAGIEERDVVLRRSRTAGCRQLVATLETGDAARVWQVIQQIAAGVKDGDGQDQRSAGQARADVLVSLVVGDVSPAPDDGPRDDEGAPEPGAAPDSRAPVRIPTPEERARLSEIHVVVFADDLTDEDCEDPDDPDGGDDGPDDSPSSPPRPPGRDRAPTRGAPPVPAPRRSPAGPRPRTGRLAAARRARAARRSLAGHGPFGHVPGIGRLAPEITRATVCAARWRRLVADPGTGVLVHRSRWTLPPPPTGASTAAHLSLLLDQVAAPDRSDPATRIEVSYRPSTLLAAHVRARDGGCISPVCHHAARGGATQLDHTTAWGPSTPTRLRGGLTEAGNLGCICLPWHNAKTHGGWDLAQPSPGSFVWTSPTGLVYERRATPLLPDLADVLG